MPIRLAQDPPRATPLPDGWMVIDGEGMKQPVGFGRQGEPDIAAKKERWRADTATMLSRADCTPAYDERLADAIRAHIAGLQAEMIECGLREGAAAIAVPMVPASFALEDQRVFLRRVLRRLADL